MNLVAISLFVYHLNGSGWKNCVCAHVWEIRKTWRNAFDQCTFYRCFLISSNVSPSPCQFTLSPFLFPIISFSLSPSFFVLRSCSALAIQSIVLSRSLSRIPPRNIGISRKRKMVNICVLGKACENRLRYQSSHSQPTHRAWWVWAYLLLLRLHVCVFMIMKHVMPWWWVIAAYSANVRAPPIIRRSQMHMRRERARARAYTQTTLFHRWLIYCCFCHSKFLCARQI